MQRLHRESESFFFYLKPDVARKLIPSISDDQWDDWKIDSAGAGGTVLFREEQPGVLIDCVLNLRAPVKGVIAQLDNYRPIVELPSSFKNATSLYATNYSESIDPKPDAPREQNDKKESEKPDDFSANFSRMSEKHAKLFISNFESRYELRVSDKSVQRQILLLKAVSSEKADEFVANNVELLNLFRSGFEISKMNVNGLEVWSQSGAKLRKQIAHAGRKSKHFNLLEDESVDWTAKPKQLWKQIPAEGIINLGDWVLIGDISLGLDIANSILDPSNDHDVEEGIDLQARFGEFSQMISLQDPLVLSMSDARRSMPMRRLASFTFDRVMDRIAETGDTIEEREQMRNLFFKNATFPSDNGSSRAERIFYAGMAFFTAYDSQITCVSKLEGNSVRLSLGLYVDEEKKN